MLASVSNHQDVVLDPFGIRLCGRKARCAEFEGDGLCSKMLVLHFGP